MVSALVVAVLVHVLSKCFSIHLSTTLLLCSSTSACCGGGRVTKSIFSLVLFRLWVRKGATKPFIRVPFVVMFARSFGFAEFHIPVGIVVASKIVTHDKLQSFQVCIVFKI